MALIELNIRNFAIIKQLEIEMDNGLTIVTGETGAGKSIVLDALNLLLGSRAETDMIRHGQDQCEITALFSINGMSDTQHWLAQRDLVTKDESSDYCLVRRVVRNNKPTKCYINDQPTTLASLKELGFMLVDLHGQHEHQSLLRKPSQRKIIDQFAEHDDALRDVAKLASQINRLQRELNDINQDQSDNADRMELMSFQLDELDEASVMDGEFEELELEHARLSNSQGLTSGIESTVDGLFHNESFNVSSALGNHINQLNELCEYDPTLKTATDLLNSALAQVDETQATLDSVLSKVDENPERLNEVEQRRDTLINLARKHRCLENELPAKHEELQAEYDKLKSKHHRPEDLQKELVILNRDYKKVAITVSKKRQRVAKQLSAMITEQMQDLGMGGGELAIQITAHDGDDDLLISEHGIDQIDFLVSTNKGMPLKAIHKTASGGELSRISLAIQVITSEKSDTPTLVFDEVDVGVGGKTAQIVGERLRNLGSNAQVICITHLPQVAAQGNQHLFINKISTDTETYSTIIKLDDEMRTTEIARMLGGAEITDRTRAHAQEMLSDSQAVN